mmetsp:Transcript_105999/g.167361  ORF Transcript_105999/g.167361 Transcript_105999/m.167361 type:complete len:750 (-) Transcript_105999:88-2337(-)
MAMSGADDGYAYAISRVTELEVDLASAMSGLKRAQDENESMMANQADLTVAYNRLQDHNDRLRNQLAREQEERHQFNEEHQRQIAMWREQLDSKARELEEFQNQMPAPRELDAIQFELAEEIHDQYRRKVEDLEAQCAAEAQRAADARRQMELQRLDDSHREQEARDEMAEELQRHLLREQSLKRQVAALEGEVRNQADKIAEMSQSRMQTRELETKVLGLQNELQEQERHSEKERKLSGEKLLARDQELTTIRRRLHDLQIDFEASERAMEQAASELDNLRRDHVRLAAQLSEAKHKNANMRPAEESDILRDEIAQLRSSVSSEREQLTSRLKVAEDRVPTLQSAVRQAELKTRQLEEERDDRERELQHERAELERTHAAEISTIRAEAEKNKHEAEKRSLAWREKETSLLRKCEEHKSQVESMTDDLSQSQLAQREAERRLRDVRSEFQQRESAATAEAQKRINALQSEVAALRDREVTLVRECSQHAGDLEAARAALRKQQQRTDALQAEVQMLSQRLDMERAQWAREADEAQLAAIRVEEERRHSMVQQLTEDHKQKMAKIQAASKRSLQKAARKRQELRQKCQELVRRLSQVCQEKAAAVKVCEENKSAYELRLTELGMVSRFSAGIGADALLAGAPAVLRKEVGSKVSLAAGCMSVWELQAMKDRLAQNAELLKGGVGRGSGAIRARDAEILSQAIRSPSRVHLRTTTFRGDAAGNLLLSEAPVVVETQEVGGDTARSRSSER